MENKIFENEMWWQENGLGWMDEVEKRRSMQPLYGIQEVVLSSIFSKLPNQSKVLEFGVGFGRHVEYLDELSNIEVYGVDQSPTMLDSLKNRLADKQELINRMILIEPRTKLPFPDKFFDIVYTVSVLIHIRPEHLQGILAELIRVSKHGILHFENTHVESSQLVFEDHSGCWGHAIVEDYAALQKKCIILSKVASNQDIYFIPLSDDIRYQQVEIKTMYRRLYLIDQRILPRMQEFEGEVGWRTIELQNRQEREGTLDQQIKALESECEKAKQILTELESKKNKLTEMNNEFRLSNNELNSRVSQLQSINSDLSRKTNELETNNIYLSSVLEDIQGSLAWKLVARFRSMDRFYAMTRPLRAFVKRNRNSRLDAVEINNTTLEANEQFDSITSAIKNKVELISEGADVAIYQPEWLGVSNSTNELFNTTIEVKEIHNKEQMNNIAIILGAKKFRTITFSGFAIGYHDLAVKIKSISPETSIKVFWHGNTTHMSEDYSWIRFQEILHLYYLNIIDSLGFAKASMAELYRLKGFRTFFVKNAITFETELEKRKVNTAEGQVIIGLYASGNTWNKNAYTQIAAASLIKGAQINATPYNERMKQFAHQLDIRIDGNQTTVPRSEMLSKMSENDINFYITFSECAPLLPLESLEMGIPCITGPNHHYFEDSSKLKDYLVVNKPDDPVEIAKKAEMALRYKEEIIHLYKEWREANRSSSIQSVNEFLGRES
ncbi:hypothetical protein PAECIP111893_00440 [Paenibacillus plantiphilus]|uniref:Methyltransferase type 11 domain-containing protein n=1 Tax=Paenibacillus plantiphilus TaxID=2905650 RepID=A0ABN8FZL2_9BACL|nr:methyltransferase domain-containing protein [Paenibacillus plantiphilus]CAH1193347.1 hypothetical protein PAECIP111893_00440 [Paenibacillus plantiphilus]